MDDRASESNFRFLPRRPIACDGFHQQETYENFSLVHISTQLSSSTYCISFIVKS